jgi:chromosome partitioning protein
MKLAIGNMKGGVGTSTLACSISAAFAKDGRSVVLIDTDRSQNTTMWCSKRRALALDPPVSITTARHSIAAALGNGVAYDIQLIDVWRHHDDIETIARSVDFWLAPSTVSTADLEATLRLYEALHSSTRQRPPKPVAFGVVLTQTPNAPRSREEAEARAFL